MPAIQTTPTRRLVIDLPEPVYQQIARAAKLTQQPPETIAAQSISGNLPPSVENAPTDMQMELLAMQSLTNEALQQIAIGHVPVEQQQRHQDLLAKNSADDITPDERQELSLLRQQADYLMVRKAYAWAILRWRGFHLPALTELPLE